MQKVGQQKIFVNLEAEVTYVVFFCQQEMDLPGNFSS